MGLKPISSMVDRDTFSYSRRRSFAGVLNDHQVTINMDGRVRRLDIVMVERLSRTVRYVDVYLRAYDCPAALRRGFERYFSFDNTQPRHSALDNQTPNSVYFGHLAMPRAK